MLFIVVALGLTMFAVFYLADSGLFRRSMTAKFDAQIIDEVEDEVYDNTGGVKRRFFKAYEFEENGEKKVVRSERPMRQIENCVGKRCVIYVDTKNRKAMEKSDIIRYRLFAAILLVLALGIMILYFYIKTNVPGAAL